MARYKTALGKVVDMASLASKHERTRAVGNMKVNARGDSIDALGKIVKPVTAKVGENYATTVGNRSAQAKKPVSKQATAQANAKARGAPTTGTNTKIDPAALTAAELELENELLEDAATEKIKATEMSKTK
tara:strand:+ start:1199 stop:1591 length:393 start_codon:yes stop_codon:yes gene_type:complete